ncbi:helix-turn-helix domain-containing protein [Rufibacter hautae]|uniref:Helix-turn-helix transcriptional regulator n=1 Tax=Rufibacter hautae TaxID=2595005 RepID=A0A5B6TDL1_9BACT|nr:helix-turn-helix transcriptional regulator [Rufibacter hautae]KAA3437104.1 helix-turn-helix transcriptional regulator [Rufibacter hautae]
MEERAFGSVMQELRKGKGLSQEELAFRCGLDRTYISLLERSLRVPTIVTLFKVSVVLEIRPEEFIARMNVQDRNYGEGSHLDQ